MLVKYVPNTVNRINTGNLRFHTNQIMIQQHGVTDGGGWNLELLSEEPGQGSKT